MQRKAADLQNQRPFHLNSSLVLFVVEILIVVYPKQFYTFNFTESYNSTPTKNRLKADVLMRFL